MTKAYDFSHRTIDGAEKSLADYEGHVLLIVNVASACGLTPQYEGLQRLYEEHKDQGLVVLGFPCNQFGAQEPGTEEEIAAFCETRFGVTFPMFAKLDVNGEEAHPLYRWLESQDTRPDGPGDIAWNFAKFLVNRRGDVVARYAPTVQPQAPELEEAIEGTLAVP